MDTVKVDFIDIDKEWDKQISDYHFDVYHLSGWISASAVVDKGMPQGIVAHYKDKKVFLPIIIREIDSEHWDATSTYGYGGPVMDKTLTDAQLDIVLEGIRTFLFEKGCVSLFMRLHPIINKEWLPTVGKALTHGLTLMSDLTKSEEEHWSETQNRHRRGIKKAMKMEVVTKIERLTKESAMVFSNIYKETMEHVNASQYYFFDDNYFFNLFENLQDRILLITAYQDGKAIGSSIYTICRESGIMQFHLGGTLNAYTHLQPSKLITHIARNWGRENNYNLLHLGGGVGSNLDSLYEYKKGFSSQELLFKTYRLVVNSSKYAALIANSWFTENDLSSDFFPLYRKELTKETVLEAKGTESLVSV
ncbi:peptidoglycan bridge formation glycyltransferase FemA/FemB family protein [Psychrobacter sp. NG25]|uniref:peptidoglycan bridge formation glycyltransferase FemA/FemB family protein n=1 Tax=Psychrobacter sp. NG25 TaxID=2782005 RepID=UPI0018839D2C|nr:peptidoglycan bridge formation glycyltransferase FemA/FemB family protein [Psychrobacter sp. NG25]MBF0659766.1 peptidoglycan bridge formation glycyltransferase FemA/FemB family protein [Psychrobacter sp. NG25]